MSDISQTVKHYLQSRASLYKMLATTSSTAEELLLKIELSGDKWTRWDWAAFLQYICCYHVAACYAQNELDNIFALSSDICKCIKETSLLDKVAVDKEVVLSLIELAKMTMFGPGRAILGMSRKHQSSLLALLHAAFTKFPDLWSMSWMWSKQYVKTRHGKKFFRTHQLQFLLPGKDSKFYESKEFYSDFLKLCDMVQADVRA